MHSRIVKILLAATIAVTGMAIPAKAAGATVAGKVTFAKELFVSATLQLEQYDADQDKFTQVATATIAPSPAPTSTSAPYKFENVEDGTYRISNPLTLAEVPTAKLGVSTSKTFSVLDGKLLVEDKAALTIPDFKLSAIGKFAVKAMDSKTNQPIADAIITLTGQFNGADATFDSFIAPNKDGLATFPIPAIGSYSLKIVDPAGLHQDLLVEKSFTSLTTNLANPTPYTPLAGGILSVTVSSRFGKAANAVVHLLNSDEEIGLATADSEGVAVIKGIAPGDYTMWVGGPLGSVLRDSDPKAVTINEGETTSTTQVLVSGLTISGTVTAATDKVSSAPVADVRIEVAAVDADGNETPVSPAQTGTDGKYSTNGLSAGTYNLYFYDESSDWQDYRLSNSILGVVVGTTNVTQQNVALPSAAVVTGKVTSSEGSAVAYTTVELISAYGDTVTSTSTDDKGQYRITRVGAGKYSLKFTNENYRTAYSDDFTAAVNKLSTQDMVLYSGSGISGKVITTKSGQGIDGVRVSAYSASGSGLIAVSSTITQADGTYIFSGLPAGSYRIKYDGSTANPPTSNFWQLSTGANGKSFGQAADVITRPGLVTTNVNPAPVTPWALVTGNVRGKVLDENGEQVVAGLENATVTLVSTDGLIAQTAETDPDGNFEISVPDGIYGVKIAATGYTTGYLGSTNGLPTLIKNFADAVKVTIEDGLAKDVGSVDVSASGGTVKVTVTDEAQEPVSDGVLVAYDSQGNSVAFTDQCDENGTFSLSGLRGNHTFSFEAPGQYAKRFVGGTTKLSDAGTTVVPVADGKSYSYKLSTVNLPNLNLKLVVDSGTNAALYTDDVTVEVYTLKSGAWSINDDLTTSAGDGTVSLGVSNGGAYRIRVVTDAPEFAPIWLGSVPFATTVKDASTITIPTTGKAPTLDNVVLNVRTGGIRGAVSDSFAGQVANAQIQLLDTDGNILQTATSREDGIYNIYRVAPGTYTLKFIAERLAIKYANNVKVQSGQTASVPMTLNSASGVTGLMLAEDGSPVVGATVSIFAAGGSGVTPINSVQTQDDGAYNLIGLPAGSYKIRFDGTTADVPTDSFWYGEQANVETFKSGATVTTKLGEYLKNIDSRPTKSWALIKGTILDSASAVSGAAISLVTVSLATLTGKVIATDLTDENGNFALYAPDGSYQIQVQATGFASGFIDATEGGDVTLSASAVGAAVVSVNDHVAVIEGGLKADDLTLDLSGTGGTATITVKDDNSKTITDGAVTAYDSAGNIAGYDDKPQSGTFTISGLSGSYRLSYEQDGVFAKTFYGGTSDISDPKTQPVTVSKTQKPSVTINVKALPKLTVNVVTGSTPASAFKQPIMVEIYSLVDGTWTLNDGLSRETSEGTISFGVSKGDQYRIRVVPNSELLTPVWVGSARLAKSVNFASTITIPATGSAPALGNVVMNSVAGVIQGSVLDQDAAGIANASVSLIDNSGSVVDSTTSRADGSYRFSQEVPGVYTIKIMADGYAIKYLKSQSVVADTITPISTQLTPATGISGRVLLDGQLRSPVVGGSVSVYSATGTGNVALQTVQTDADGNYNFVGLPAGSYKLYFDNSIAEVPADSFWYGGGEENAGTFRVGQSVTATLGSYASGIDPAPASAWTLFTGNVHDGQWSVVGGSVSLVSVSLISLAGNALLTGVTDERGNFAIYAPDGAYRIKVAAPGYSIGYVDASEVGTPVLTASAATAAVLFISAGNLSFDSGLTETALSLDLGANGGKVTVSIKDDLGQAVTEGLVSAYDKTGKIVAQDSSSVGGVFSLSGLLGYYRISYQLDGVFAETFFGDTTSLGATGTKTVTVTDGSSITAAIKVKSLPKLTVNINGGSSAYKQPTLVEVYTQEDGQWVLDQGLTQETSDGALTFGVINSSQYRIRLVPANPALAPVWLGANSSALTVNLAKSILIPAAGAVTPVTGVVNVSAATLSGQVADSFQTLMAGVTVDLLASNGDVVAQTTTLEDGTYTFIQLIPGSYKLKFSLERFADKSASVNLTAGQSATQDAVLDSASGISGRVLGSGLQQSLQIVGFNRRGLDVVTPTDLPVAGAVVGLYLASGNGLTPVRTEITDEDGYFNFSGLVPGSYRMRIDGTVAAKPAERTWYASGEINASSFATATTIEAKRGELVTDIDPAPLKFWTVFDGLLKAGLSTISGATVTLTSTSGGGSFAGQTDADGFFSVFAPDGAYLVQISAPGYPSGFISDTETGVILDSIAANATILNIANGSAAFTTSLDLMNDPLDLASIGGSLQVQVVDGNTVLTEGTVTVYNRAGAVVAYTDVATGGTFNIDGLRGDYKVSYELPGSYALTFIGGTKSVSDPATVLVKVRDKAVTAAKLTAVALPKFTVNVKSGSSAYTQPATINVYKQEGKSWSIQPDLGGSTFTGSYTFGAVRGESYRVQVVPDDLNTSVGWVGNANALSVADATSYTVPATGAAPTMPAVVLNSAVQVTVPVKNGRPVALENVVVHLKVKVNAQGEGPEVDSQVLGTLEADAWGSVTFNRVPVSLFPISVTGTSGNSAEESWTWNAAAPTGNVETNQLEFNEVAILAALTGSIKTLDGVAIAGQTVTLLTDEGDEYASTDTDSEGKYSFTDLPLGVHFTVNSEPESGFLVVDGDADFTGRSGDKLEINFIQHYSVQFGGVVLDADGNPRAEALVNIYRVAGTKLDVNSDDVLSVYTDAEGKWTFDGAEFNAEVGNYAFFADGLDSDFTPAYLGNDKCVTSDNLPDPKSGCAVAKPADALVVNTSKDVQSLTNITLVLGATDNSAPTGVKISKSPTATTLVTPTWQWTGNDGIDGKALSSQVVIASAAYGKAMGPWSAPIDVTGTSYSIMGVRGTTYCFAVSMLDKSGNASAYTAPSCSTVAMDDTAMKPAKTKLWSQVAVKGSFLGKVTMAKKNSKNAVLNVTKAAAGKSLCIYYATGPKFGSFTVTVNGKKLGKPIATAGKAGQIKSICFTTAIKANSKIAINVAKAGNGVQIDGYAITVAKPAPPTPPVTNLKVK
ncbi:MAG: hypothetical protein EBS36_04150 [Actinobacteria bacterium]|nr:hypothetical protein [Actinomycetota bacterium]NBY15577.1 hypothetical protein [Actinomycetota bacterium]